MFNNANVLFRVRFENGTSVVARSEQGSDPIEKGRTKRKQKSLPSPHDADE
jgi:hypothetical protein